MSSNNCKGLDEDLHNDEEWEDIRNLLSLHMREAKEEYDEELKFYSESLLDYPHE